MMSNATAALRPQPAACWKPRWPAIASCLLLSLILSSCTHGTLRTPEIPAAVLALAAPLPPIGEDLKADCPPVLPPVIDPSIAGLGRTRFQVLQDGQFVRRTLFRFAATVLGDQVIARHIHCLDERVLVRPHALPKELVRHRSPGKLGDAL